MQKRIKKSCGLCRNGIKWNRKLKKTERIQTEVKKYRIKLSSKFNVHLRRWGQWKEALVQWIK